MLFRITYCYCSQIVNTETKILAKKKGKKKKKTKKIVVKYAKNRFISIEHILLIVQSIQYSIDLIELKPKPDLGEMNDIFFIHTHMKWFYITLTSNRSIN